MFSGHGSLLVVWESHSQSWPSRGAIRLHLHGCNHFGGVVYSWRAIGFHAVDRRIHSTCGQVHQSCHGCCCWLEFLFVCPALYFGGLLTGDRGYQLAIVCPAELSAAATVIQFWRPDINPAVWLSVFIIVIAVVNFSGVRIYGEVSGSCPPLWLRGTMPLTCSV